MTNVFSCDNEKLQLTRLQRAEGKLSTELDGETVILDTKKGGYSSLDSVGTEIWNALEQPICFEKIVDRILGKYEVGRQQCIDDVREFLGVLHERGLIAVLTNE